MKNTAQTGRDRLPCGMVSLKMFQINHSKAMIIAYLDLRSGLKNYTFNQQDISNKTTIGKTGVRRCLKELTAEGVLSRKGKSFYKLNLERIKELYYEASESDFNVSFSDTDASKNDTDVSESDAIHSSKIKSSSLKTSELDSSEANAPELPAIVKELLSKSPKEQAAWLARIDANKTMENDLRSGKDVMMTAQFEDNFANW